MWTNDPRSLPDWIEDAYETLLAQSTEPQEGVSHERAHDLLLAHEAFPDERDRSPGP